MACLFWAREWRDGMAEEGRSAGAGREYRARWPARLRAADPALRLKLVRAHEGKSARAEPVAMLFERRRVRLHGKFPSLEAELTGMIAGGGYDGPGRSPDRADAMVWALADLMVGPRREPRVAGF